MTSLILFVVYNVSGGMENFAHLVILFKKQRRKICNHFDHCAVPFFSIVPLTHLVTPESQEI